MKKKQGKTSAFVRCIDQLIQVEEEVKQLPALSAVHSAQLNNEIAIEHLYYSSKIEGSNLTDARIEKAIHGKEVATS